MRMRAEVAATERKMWLDVGAPNIKWRVEVKTFVVNIVSTGRNWSEADCRNPAWPDPVKSLVVLCTTGMLVRPAELIIRVQVLLWGHTQLPVSHRRGLRWRALLRRSLTQTGREMVAA